MATQKVRLGQGAGQQRWSMVTEVVVVLLPLVILLLLTY